MSAVELRYTRLHVFLPVESFIDGVGAVDNDVAVERLVIGLDSDAQVTEPTSYHKITFEGFHDFELLNGDSQGLVTIQEFGFVPRARPNYRVACIRTAPRFAGEAACLQAGGRNACA